LNFSSIDRLSLLRRFERAMLVGFERARFVGLKGRGFKPRREAAQSQWRL
jgi:hypothetical protein